MTSPNAATPERRDARMTPRPNDATQPLFTLLDRCRSPPSLSSLAPRSVFDGLHAASLLFASLDGPLPFFSTAFLCPPAPDPARSPLAHSVTPNRSGAGAPLSRVGPGPLSPARLRIPRARRPRRLDPRLPLAARVCTERRARVLAARAGLSAATGTFAGACAPAPFPPLPPSHFHPFCVRCGHSAFRWPVPSHAQPRPAMRSAARVTRSRFAEAEGKKQRHHAPDEAKRRNAAKRRETRGEPERWQRRRSAPGRPESEREGLDAGEWSRKKADERDVPPEPENSRKT